MARFYLNLQNTHLEVSDDEGVDALDPADAREKAIRGIRDFLGHEITRGILDLRGKIDIVDDKGVTVMTVPFAEAVRIIMS